MSEVPATFGDTYAFPNARTETSSFHPDPSRRRRFVDACSATAVMLLAAGLWCAVTGRITLAAWQTPTVYSGDALEVLTHIQAAAEWDVLPTVRDHVHRLAAPFGGAWSEYPAADDVLLLGIGQLSRIVGLAAAANFALMLAQMTAAGAFFFAARWLGNRREWSAVGAILFAFSYHNISRGLPHLSLVFSYTIPLGLLSCWLVARSRRLHARSPAAFLCFVSAVGTGIGNPYNLFLFVQLMGWAVIAQALTRRRAANLVAGIAWIGVAMVTFFVVNADVWLAVPDEGAAPLIARNYGGVEQYALKPIELFLPPANHRFAPLAFWGHRYLRWSDWQGETFSAYLGIVAGIGIVVLLASLVVRALRQRRITPGRELQALWVLGFSTIGGGNSVLALFTGLNIFRATNRYSEFLLAIGLFVVVRLASLRSRRLPRPLSLATAALLLGIGLLDQIPASPSEAARVRPAQRWAADERFGAELERALPANAMVFQLPYVGFPEARSVGHLPDYEHFRPYLHTSTLRFSYGALKGRARSEWYRNYADLPPGVLVPKLQQCGFAAICIDRRGYENGARELLADFRRLGVTPMMVSPSGDQIVLPLQPARHPTLPLATRLTFGEGWNRPGSGLNRWAYGPASMAYFNPEAVPIKVDLMLVVTGEGSRRFTLSANDRPLVATKIDASAQTIRVPSLELLPGITRFDLSTAEPAVRTSEERSRLRAFAVRNVRLALHDPAADRTPL